MIEEKKPMRWRVWQVRNGQREMIWVDGIVTETWAKKILDGANHIAEQMGRHVRYEMEETSEWTV